MKYTVHRALAMLKTTKARIAKELASDEPFVRVTRGQDGNVHGVPVGEIERSIQGRYDRITALISNYSKVKAAVIRSNAGVTADTELRKAKVAGQLLTVAELIEISDSIYGMGKKGSSGNKPAGFKASLLEKLKSDYADAQQEFSDLQDRADAEVLQYIKALSVKKDAESIDEAAKATIEATSKMLHKQKDPMFIDPLKIAEKISALENEIEEFITEADAVLSEQNALTTIEVDLADIQ